MKNEFYNELTKAMHAIEKNSINKIYLLNPDVDDKAQRLFSDFASTGINARIDYHPAYMQIAVVADTYVLDIYTNELKQALHNADGICIDSVSDGMLHIECIFNNAFRMAGVLNE